MHVTYWSQFRITAATAWSLSLVLVVASPGADLEWGWGLQLPFTSNLKKIVLLRPSSKYQLHQ